MHLSPLPELILRPLVEEALREDLGGTGDITTATIIPDNISWRAALNTRQKGILAGLDLARLAFQILDPTVTFKPFKRDGDTVEVGDKLAEVAGAARSLLSSERVALNFLCHLSGIASVTAQFVQEVKPYKTRICCTRKTTPGLRAVEKYAVRAGGAINHRFGLNDAVLIKDNHISIAGGITQAIKLTHKTLGHLVKVEVEVDTLAQLEEIVASLPVVHIDAILLDNMDLSDLKQAVEKVAGRCVIEASGGINLKNVAAVAATGVDVISVGWITHSAQILDIGLDAL